MAAGAAASPDPTADPRTVRCGVVRCWQGSADAGKVYQMLTGSIRWWQGPWSLKMVAASLKMVTHEQPCPCRRRASKARCSGARRLRTFWFSPVEGRRTPPRSQVRSGRSQGASAARSSPPQAWRRQSMPILMMNFAELAIPAALGALNRGGSSCPQKVLGSREAVKLEKDLLGKTSLPPLIS